MQFMDDVYSCDSCQSTHYSNSNYITTLLDWFKKKLNQIAPIFLGNQAKYPLEFWHEIVGLSNQGCLLEDVPASIVPLSEIYELFDHPNHDCSKKLCVSHIKDEKQAKEIVEWHNKVYCCQPYNGELCQCFVRAYLAHFGGRINVNWALIAYEYYNGLQKQASKKDSHVIHVPIPALDEQLFALEKLLIEIVSNHVSFIQPQSFCPKNGNQSNNNDCANFIKTITSTQIAQNKEIPKSLLTSNNSTVLQENEKNMLSKSINTKLNQKQLVEKNFTTSKINKLDKPCERFLDYKYKDIDLSSKEVTIGQQVHCYAKNASKKRGSIHTLPLDNCIGKTNLMALEFSKTPKIDAFNSFGAFSTRDSFQQAKSIVDELIEISTSEEVSAREEFFEDNIFSPRKILIKNFTGSNKRMSAVSTSRQTNETKVDLMTSCVNVFPQNNCNEFPTLLGQLQESEDKNEHQIEKVESTISHFIEKKSTNSNLENSNDHLSTNTPHQKKESITKPKQRIGISILIQKLSEHNNKKNNGHEINNKNNGHEIEFNEVQENMRNHFTMDAPCYHQKPLSCTIDELTHIQKPIEAFQNYNLDSSCTTTTISPPHEKNPLSIDQEVLNLNNKSEEINFASEPCDLITLDAIDQRLHDIPFSCSKTKCSNCNGNSLGAFKSPLQIIEGERVIDGNKVCGLELLNDSCLDFEPKALGVFQNHKEGGGEGNLGDSSIIHNNYVEPTNGTEFRHSNSKLDSPLRLLKVDVRDPTTTINDRDDEGNQTTGILNFSSNPKLPHVLEKEHNYQDGVSNEPAYLDVSPLDLHKTECCNNIIWKENEEIQSLNATDVQLSTYRNETSSLSCSNCSTQEDEVNFPSFAKLPITLECANDCVNDTIHKHHFCATLVHHKEDSNINMKYKSCKSSLVHSLNNELELSTTSNTKTTENGKAKTIEIEKVETIENVNARTVENVIAKTMEHSNNLDDECKPHIILACVDDDEEKDNKEIRHANEIQQCFQALQECNRSITQSGTSVCVGAEDDMDMLCSIRAHVPSMRCAQAGYILEKKKATLAAEKATVENLIRKGDAQHELNQRLMFILRSKLGEYEKICSEVQNPGRNASSDETMFQASQNRDGKQNNELIKEDLQVEIVELYNVHRSVQAQLDMDNCLLVGSLMAVDTLTLDVENARKEVERLINEEYVDQHLVFKAPKSNLEFEMNIVDPTCNNETYELSKAMKTMIKIQQNRCRSTIDENSFSNDDKKYSLVINDILNKEVDKMDETCSNSKIDVELPNELDDTIMPTMASLSGTSSKLKSDSNSTKTMAMLFVDRAKKQDIDVESTIVGDDNILQWLKTNLHNKAPNPLEIAENERCDEHDCNTMFTSNCFKQRSKNNGILSSTTNEAANCDDSCSSSTDATNCSNHYYDILQCKQRQKHEKCDIHGIDLKMVCAYPICKLSNPIKVRKDVMQRYKICDPYVKDKLAKNKKSTHSKLKSPHQNIRIVKDMSTAEQVFEKYKMLGYTKGAHDHLNEFDSDLLFLNKQRNILAKSKAMKVVDRELKNMIDDIVNPNQARDKDNATKKSR